MNDAAVVLSAAGLAKRFTTPAPVEALRQATMELRRGELAALIGPSGAGKSTLLTLLSGLQAPTAGRVILAGEDLARLSPAALARVRNLSVGYVFQFHHLLPELTALENVMLPGLIAAREGWRPAPLESIAERARRLLAATGLERRAAHLPTQLSGGEAQRAALARALMNAPAVVLADEPTGNLDQRTSIELLEMLQDLNRREGQTFLIATHNPEIVRRATRVLEMTNGELVS